MKKYFILFSIGLITASCSTETLPKTPPTTVAADGISTSTFKVWGNCETCKETIEASLKTDGIVKADWNVDSKIITVEYDSSKISIDKIEKDIASVGYDNEKYKGDDKAYAALPECCKYERK
jgi:mercuric ion binding protein